MNVVLSFDFRVSDIVCFDLSMKFCRVNLPCNINCAREWWNPLEKVQIPNAIQFPLHIILMHSAVLMISSNECCFPDCFILSSYAYNSQLHISFVVWILIAKWCYTWLQTDRTVPNSKKQFLVFCHCFFTLPKNVRILCSSDIHNCFDIMKTGKSNTCASAEIETKIRRRKWMNEEEKHANESKAICSKLIWIKHLMSTLYS